MAALAQEGHHAGSSLQAWHISVEVQPVDTLHCEGDVVSNHLGIFASGQGVATQCIPDPDADPDTTPDAGTDAPESIEPPRGSDEPVEPADTSTGSGGTAAAAAPSSEDSSSGCAMRTRRSEARGWAIALGAAAFVTARRRRAARRVS